MRAAFHLNSRIVCRLILSPSLVIYRNVNDSRFDSNICEFINLLINIHANRELGVYSVANSLMVQIRTAIGVPFSTDSSVNYKFDPRARTPVSALLPFSCNYVYGWLTRVPHEQLILASCDLTLTLRKIKKQILNDLC